MLLFGGPIKANIGAAGVQEIRQGGSGEPDDAQESNDKVGQAMIAGRYEAGSETLDFALVAATGEMINSLTKAGALSALYAGPAGLLVPDEQQFFSQATPNFGDLCEANDQVGLAMASGDFNGDGSPDVAIGVPEEDFSGAVTNSGIVHVLYFPGEPAMFADDFEAGNLDLWSAIEPPPAP